MIECIIDTSGVVTSSNVVDNKQIELKAKTSAKSNGERYENFFMGEEAG